MSMLSAQIDELRKYADRADGTFPMLASALRDAADTIWQLRDDLQRANDVARDVEHDESCAWDRVRKAEAENAKLRKLVNDMWTCVSHGSGWDCTGCKRDPDNVCIMGISEFSQRMSDLGIEVE